MALDLAAVKSHLQIPASDTDPDGDADLTAKLAQAEAIILDYLKLDARPDPATAPNANGIIDSMVLLQVGELWRFRGDDPTSDSAPTTPGDLHPTITNLGRRLRDPALA
jgi:hypothetical protein